MSKEQQLIEEARSIFYEEHDGLQSSDVTDNAIKFIVRNTLKAEKVDWIDAGIRKPINDDVVEIPQSARYNRYKPESRQFKKGIIGRWQVYNGYGWDNLGYEPSRWLPSPPAINEDV